jgi:hypothetical protein
MFDFHLDYQQAPQLRGVRDEYVSMAKSSLATKQVSCTRQIHMWKLMIDLFRCSVYPISYSHSASDANRGGDEGNSMPTAGDDRKSTFNVKDSTDQFRRPLETGLDLTSMRT